MTTFAQLQQWQAELNNDLLAIIDTYVNEAVPPLCPFPLDSTQIMGTAVERNWLLGELKRSRIDTTSAWSDAEKLAAYKTLMWWHMNYVMTKAMLRDRRIKEAKENTK